MRKVKWGWESDFERERERELFKVNKCYVELVERINIERIVDNKDLLCDIIRTVNDDYIDDNKHLPCDVIDVVVAVSYTHLDVYKRQVKMHTKQC